MPRARRSARRGVFLLWLRRVHLYVGLWGAVVGLLFGITGIVLNHRAVLKIPVDKAIPSTMQWAVPASGFESPRAMAEWLRAELDFEPHHVILVKRHPEQWVHWGDRPVRQPERWTVMLQSPKRGATADHFPGNRFVRIDRVDATAIGFLARLHTSTGASAAWVLLADTIAGAFVLLCATGLLLWTQLHTLRLAACATSLGALALAVAFA